MESCAAAKLWKPPILNSVATFSSVAATCVQGHVHQANAVEALLAPHWDKDHGGLIHPLIIQ
jgi:hypothetical protein